MSPDLQRLIDLQRLETQSADARAAIAAHPQRLAEADAHRLIEIVQELRSRGVSIIYVSHRMPEVFALADRVTVRLADEPAAARIEAIKAKNKKKGGAA